MRKSTLTVLAYLIVFPAIYLLPALADMAGLPSAPQLSVVMTALASAAIAGVLSYLLTPLNKRVLAWRKERGRDIEAEERHETTAGIIRVTPNDGD